MPFVNKLEKKDIETTMLAIRKNNLHRNGESQNIQLINNEEFGKKKVEQVEGKDLTPYLLNPNRVTSFSIPTYAYDESIDKHEYLEAHAYAFSLSLTRLAENEYINHSIVDLALFTKARALSKKSEKIIYSDDPESDFKSILYHARNNLIIDDINEESVVLIDGPVIGANISYGLFSKFRMTSNRMYAEFST